MSIRKKRDLQPDSSTISEYFFWQERNIKSMTLVRFALAVLSVTVIIFLFGKSIMGFMLQEGAENGSVVAVKSMLKLGVDVNSKDSDGWTALMIASEEGNTEVVKVLLKYEADVNLRATGPGRYDWFCEPVGTGQTALGIAKFANQQDIVTT